MVTNTIGLKLVSSVVRHVPIGFLMKALRVLVVLGIIRSICEALSLLAFLQLIQEMQRLVSLVLPY